jgi:hypothetical protein
MKRIRYTPVALAALLLVGLASVAFANTPTPTSAVLHLRVFNDGPGSILTTTNSYPGSIKISDQVLNACGYANLHLWEFSTDGVNDASFDDNATFSYGCDVTLTSVQDQYGAEGGLSVTPWWAHYTDGKFMLNTATGEIACFGGRLPFYTFTGVYGLHYVSGTTVHMGITYYCNTLNSFNPGTIEYTYKDGSGFYSSGKLPFDSGNLSEGPVHGLWGILNDAVVGGYFQPKVDCGNDAAGATCQWDHIEFAGGVTKVTSKTWGSVRQLYVK